MLLPAAVGDYTDFYASIFHATNVGKLFRPEIPCCRITCIFPSAITGALRRWWPRDRRCAGQRTDTRGHRRTLLCANQALDYELELGFFVSAGNSLGEPVPIKEAEEHIFGVCLLNDWSARDVQSWEYQPLGRSWERTLRLRFRHGW